MIKKELGTFLLVGMLTVLVDFASYTALVSIAMMRIDIAKAAGFLIGTLFAYFANRFWTFGTRAHAPGSAGRFALLYLLTLAANIGVNAAALRLLDEMWGYMQLAFVLATGVSAVLNFIGMKWFVFKARSLVETA